MDDIYLTTSSGKKGTKVVKIKKQKRRNFFQFLTDLIIKTLFVALILSIDFTLFANAGSYTLFEANSLPQIEAIWVYGTILTISLVVMFVCSFSLTLQNLLISLTAGFTLLAIFNQFALFTPDAILLPYAQKFGLPIENIFSSFSHYILAIILVFVTFFIFTYARRKTQFVLLIGLLLFQGYLFAQSYMDTSSRYFAHKQLIPDETSHPDGANIVYITLTEAPTFNKLKSLSANGTNASLSNAANTLLGFYHNNNFTYYPNSYVRQYNQPYMNLAETLNPNIEPTPQALLSDTLHIDDYWDFKNLRKEPLYLKNNKLFEDFHKQDYNIRVYQNDNIELCTANNLTIANTCIKKTGFPTNFSKAPLNKEQKFTLLLSQWLYSTGYIPSIDPVLNVASIIIPQITELGFYPEQLSSYNSPEVFNRILDDIKFDSGNNVYFAVIDMPSQLYMYDSLCNIKPLTRWISASNTQKPINIRYNAMAEQTECLYGNLENFIQELKKSNKLKQTTIIIQGLDTAFPSTPGLEKDMLKSLQNNKQAGFAIYSPKKEQADIDYRLCSTSSLLQEFLNPNYKCTELEEIPLTAQLKEEILQKVSSFNISSAEVQKASNKYNDWYSSWATHRQINNTPTAKEIPLEKSNKKPLELPQKSIEKTPEVKSLEVDNETKAQTTEPQPAVVNQAPEASIEANIVAPEENNTEEEAKEKNITPAESVSSESVQENTNLKQEEVNDLDKPEILKKEFRAKQEELSSQAQETIVETVEEVTAEVEPQMNLDIKLIDNTSYEL